MLRIEPRAEAESGRVSDEVRLPGVEEQNGGKCVRLFGGSLFWVALGSLALAVVFGRVPLLNMTAGAVGGDVDGYNNIWNYYWLKTALLDLHRNPFYTDYIYYPIGISLRFHTFNPFNGLVAMPLNLLLGYIPTFNLIFVVAPFFTALFSYLLIKDMVGNSWAAFVGAAVATYADYHVVVFLSTGQSSYITLQFLPLYFFFLFRALRGNYELRITNYELRGGEIDGGKGRLWGWGVYAVLSVVTLLAITLTDWQYLMFAVFTTLLYFVFVLFTRREWREKRNIFARLAIIGGVYAAIVSLPLLLPMIKEAAESPWLNVSYQAVKHSIDVGWLLSPGIGIAGVALLVLAGVGLWAAVRRRQSREMGLFWLLAILIFYLISLGPVLLVNGQPTGVPMVYSVLQNLPVFSAGRDPARFSLIATLGTGILVAFGVRWLLQDRGQKEQGRRAVGLLSPIVVALSITLLLSGVMTASGEVMTSAPDWPDFYRQLGNDKESYAILELPLFSDEGRGADVYQVYQALHNKLRFSGRLARDRKLTNPNNFVKRSSLFRHLWLLDFPASFAQGNFPERDILKRTDYKTQGVPILNYYNVRYIVMYKEALKPDNWERMESLIHEALGGGVRPLYENRQMRVYKVPDGPPASNPLSFDVGEGWSGTQAGADGTVYRWADNGYVGMPVDEAPPVSADLYSMNLSKKPIRALLRFTANPYKQARTLKVTLNGYEVGSIHLKPEEGLKQTSLEMTLPPGNNLISFASPEPPLPTDDPKADARLLNFAVREVSLSGRQTVDEGRKTKDERR